MKKTFMVKSLVALDLDGVHYPVGTRFDAWWLPTVQPSGKVYDACDLLLIEVDGAFYRVEPGVTVEKKFYESKH